MSIQIQIAQDHDDDQAVIAWLAERGEWRCLPRILGGRVRAVPLDLVSQDLVVFPADNEAIVTSGAAEMPPFEGNKRVAASPAARGYYFEWDRTQEERPRQYVVGGEQVSRIYYEPKKPPT